MSKQIKQNFDGGHSDHSEDSNLNLKIMVLDVLTNENLQNSESELLADLKNLFQIGIAEEILWLRSAEVKELLKFSAGTLQCFRVAPYAIHALWQNGRKIIIDLEKALESFKNRIL